MIANKNYIPTLNQHYIFWLNYQLSHLARLATCITYYMYAKLIKLTLLFNPQGLIYSLTLINSYANTHNTLTNNTMQVDKNLIIHFNIKPLHLITTLIFHPYFHEHN